MHISFHVSFGLDVQFIFGHLLVALKRRGVLREKINVRKEMVSDRGEICARN